MNLQLNWYGMRCSHSPGNSSSKPEHCNTGLQDLETVSSSQPLKLEDMPGISDTLQLGIKLFGPKFVADVASGKLTLSSASPELVTQNGTDVPESANASVFPEMFDLTAVSGTCIKPGHKILWHDRKDKLRKTYLMRKAGLTKLCNKESASKTVATEIVSEQSVSYKPMEKLQESKCPLDPFSSPYRRKRGRPPKRLKMFSGIEDVHMCIQNTETSQNASQNTSTKDNCTDNMNSVDLLLFPECTASVRCAFGNEGSSRRVRGSYRQYTAADKLGIVNFGIKYGSTAASRKYSIPESTVRSWTKKMDTLIMQMKLSETASENKILGLLVDKQDLSTCHIIDGTLEETPRLDVDSSNVIEVKIQSENTAVTDSIP